MRILYIVGRLGMGGDSTAIFNTLDILIEEGKLNVCDVDFLTHDIGYNRLKVQELRQQGYKVYILPGDVRKMGPIKYFTEVYKLLKENGSYDVVHTHTSVQSGVALLAAKACGVKKRVCHAHTNSIQRKTSAISKWLFTPLFKKLINYSATDMVACGKMAGEFLYGKHEFRILKNGIDLNSFRKVSQREVDVVSKQLIDKENQVLIGHIGRFSKMKNQEYILTLASKMIDDNVKFVLVGDGEGYDRISRLLTEKKMPVELVGRRSDIAQLLMAFDLLILPSLDGEGFPVTLVEAQAAGCPCIVSTNVTREADLGMGLVSFVDLNDGDEWIRQIKHCKGKKMSSNKSIETVQSLGFSKKNAANDWLDVYESTVKL